MRRTLGPIVSVLLEEKSGRCEKIWRRSSVGSSRRPILWFEIGMDKGVKTGVKWRLQAPPLKTEDKVADVLEEM